jgi:hypothetical protein
MVPRLEEIYLTHTVTVWPDAEALLFAYHHWAIDHFSRRQVVRHSDILGAAIYSHSA